MARAVFLMELDFGGRTWRFATEPTTATINGVDRRFEAPLSVQGGVTLEFPIFREAGRLDRAPVVFTFPEGFDFRDALAEGHSLYLSEARLWLVLPGAEPVKLISGDLQDVTRGRADDPISGTVYAAAQRRSSTVPPASYVVTTETFANVTEESLGAPYPIVVGSPGDYTQADGTTGGTSGSKAVIVDPGEGPAVRLGSLLLSGGHCGITGTESVTVANNGYWKQGGVTRAASQASATISNTYDDLGQPICVVPINYPGSGSPLDPGTADSPYTEWYVNWAGTLGIRDLSGTAISTADQLVDHFLYLGNDTVDYRRMDAARAALSQYRFAASIEAPGDPIGMLRDNVLSLVPATLVYGPDGTYVRMWDPFEPSRLALTEGVNVFRSDMAVTERLADTLSSRFEVRFAVRRYTGSYQRIHIMTGNPDETVDANLVTTLSYNANLTAAFFKLGRGDVNRGLVADPIETDWVYDDSTANRVLSWRAGAFSRPWESIPYDGDYELLGLLERGDPVTLTDSGLGLTAVRGIVGRITYDITGMSLVVQTQGRPF